MKEVSSDFVREEFIEFFKSKKHSQIQPASLIPENDPTVLFTTAGMHPLVPFLLGEKHPQGKRLCNFQKCIRTQDIEEVGDAWHLTFFEMLGNWSIGDYFKKEAIEFSFKFLTGKKKGLGLPVEMLAVTCFIGDKDCPKDNEAAKVWKKLGIPAHKIAFLPKAQNWWGPAGLTGPCGPDSEMFYYVGKEKPLKKSNPGTDEKDWCEIWNDVFMQYNKTNEGKFEELRQKNVDTGMGLERTTAVLNGFSSAFETDLLKPIFDQAASLTKLQPEIPEVQKSLRIITDHLRAATFILGDEKGISPSNVDQGYVLRRLIRRAIRHARLIGIEENFTVRVAQKVVERFKGIYPELDKNHQRIFEELDREETRFKQTLEKGIHLAEKEFSALQKGETVPAKIVFDLYQSFGFPLEMTEELAREKRLEIDVKGFESLLLEHQELSRKGAEQKFKGGLSDHSESTTALHTATHLLNEALRRIVDQNIFQKGSNITAERLRFDFPLDRKLTAEEIKKVEDLVNQKISEGLTVEIEVMGVEKAKAAGAQGVFDAKYSDSVKVYTVLNSETQEVFSREICGGPHVKSLKELGKFRILKEESSAAGIRRIKAVLEK
ncbi:MAG: alanine--tRNA ligase [Candidatus Diapherotrites archaeon]|nr:alanine--tRNA ligase [Candidatus Diapherotrites archaeon]